MLLTAWLLAVAIGGMLFNLWLARILNNPNSTYSWGWAITYGFCTHTIVGGALMALATYAIGGYREEIGYYIYTFVLAFVSVPVAQVGFFQTPRT